MNDEPQHKHRKYWLLCLFAVFIAILGVVLPDNEIAFEIVGNNTDLCDYNHTSNICNGTRQNNTVYWANDSAIILNVFAHANAAAQTGGVFIYRNGVLYAPQSGRPLAEPEQTWRDPGSVIIPKGWNYSALIYNAHHFEWREDKILSGRNGTLSIINNNYTNITQSGGGGVSFDGNPVNLNGSNLFNGTISNYSTLDYTNSSLAGKVNKTGDNISGKLCLYNDATTCDYTSSLNEPFLINTSIDNGAVSKIATQMEIAGKSHAPVSFAYGMHLTTKVSPANVSVYAPAWGVGFYSSAQCDTAFGDFGNCAAGYLARLTKNGTGAVTTAYGLYIEKQDAGTTNYAIYSAGNNMSYLAGNLTLNPLALAGSGNYSILIADSTGKIIAIPMNGSGNHYICANTAGLPYPGTPGC